MIIRRIHDPEAIERAIHASGAEMFVDGFEAANWLADPGNIALTLGDDVALFDAVGWGHYLFTSRGSAAMRAARAMLAEAFGPYGKRVVTGQTPISCCAARMFNRRLGFQSLGTVETPRGEVEVFMMTEDKFLRK